MSKQSGESFPKDTVFGIFDNRYHLKVVWFCGCGWGLFCLFVLNLIVTFFV